ncbi:MAG: ATP-binding protein [Thainema sp.]
MLIQKAIRTFRRQLCIRDKISVGYILILSITVIGTGVGFAISHRYERAAIRNLAETRLQESRLRDLQTNIAALPFHQQILLNSLGSPEEFQRQQLEINQRLAVAEQSFQQLRGDATVVSSPKLLALLDSHRTTLSVYQRELEILIDEFPVYSSTGEQRNVSIQTYLKFVKSPKSRRLYLLTQDIAPFVQTASQRYQVAQQNLNAAERAQVHIIIASAFISIILSILCAWLTSRAITKPLNQVTQIARRVRDENNLDLHVPVASFDEVGDLATSFNQLIQQIRRLLDAQRQEQAEKLIESERMASLGRMLAGVAHEINNPINFVYGNINFAENYINDLFQLIQIYETELSPSSDRIQDAREELDLEFIKSDLPKLLSSMKVGSERARQIVLSLRNFSRLNESETHLLKVHDCIDGALLILRNRIKNHIQVNCHYGSIPEIEGYAGSLYQVFTNLIGNAVDALEEQATDSVKQIQITTGQYNNEQIYVEIADNGPGIPEHVRERIFEPFFTTKPADIGTGLGLAISCRAIDRHQGQMTCESQVGHGTRFTIFLPVQLQSSQLEPTETISTKMPDQAEEDGQLCQMY